MELFLCMAEGKEKVKIRNKNVHVRRETNDYTFPKAFWKNDRSLMKTS